MSQTMIEVESLTKHYGPVKALQGVTFEVHRGQVVGLLGPNGAGKTTAMRILTGFVAPTEGRASVDGLDVVEDAPGCRRRIGYLPEGNPLYHEFRVGEALAFAARLHRMPVVERRAAVEKSVEIAGLKGHERRLVGALSKGMRQRVGLAQALMHEPDVLILDEPTSGLDPIQQEEMRNLIRALGEERTVILSTHILPEVEAACHRAIIIHQGRMVADGSVAEIKRETSRGAAARLTIRGKEDAIRSALAFVGAGLSVDALAGASDLFDVRAAIDATDERGQLERIAGAVLGAGLGLSHLTSQVASLEEVFAALTKDDVYPVPSEEVAQS